MEAGISALLAKANDAIKRDKEAEAKQYALKAIIATDIEKDMCVSDQASWTTENILACTYIKIYDVLEKINENATAARCLYKAMLFDPYMDPRKYRERTVAVWKKTFQTKRVNNVKRFLSDIAELGKLAERLEKWSVALQIHEDVYTFVTEVGAEELLRHKEVTDSMKYCGGWYSKLGMHENIQRLCCTILKEACDYDDVETLELLARSLYATKDFNLAVDICRLAIKYCENEENANQMKELMSEIQEKLNSIPICISALREDCLNGANMDIASSSNVLKHSENRKEWRIHGTNDEGPSSSLHSENWSLRQISEAHCNSDPSPTTTKLIKGTIEKLKVEACIDHRRRYISTSSTETQETSGYESNMSDADSDNTTVADSSSSTICTPDENLSLDTLEYIGQEELSFYEQSCKLHSKDYSIMTELDKDQILLQTGIKLSPDFLYLYEDSLNFIRSRPPFYTKFLNKSELEQMIRQEPKKYIRCTIQLKRSHEAVCFPVNSHDETNTIEINGRQKIGQVFNDDEVVVEILNDANVEGKRFGKVVGIWNRRHMKNVTNPVFVCTLDADDDSLNAQPLCKTVPKLTIIRRETTRKYNNKNSRRNKIEIYDYNEAKGRLCNARIEDINPAEQNSRRYLVAYIKWGLRDVYPRGIIIKIFQVGKSILSGLDLLNLQHNVPKFYRKETVGQVAGMLDHDNEPPSSYLQDRRNLTKMNVFTIDPIGCRDHDDALSFEKTDAGYKVGVHIADVSAYIEKDSPVDREAKRRGTTFYSDIQKPRHMLPEHLSTNMFSLIRDKVRLTISLFFHIDTNGRPLQMEGNDCEIVKSYIRSRRSLTYEQAQAMITAEQGDDDDIVKDVKGLFKVVHMIRKNRLGNSMFAMDLDWAENCVIEEASREAHYLVEEIMTMANKKVAQRLLRSNKTCVPLRCHPHPSRECLEEFVRRYGNYINISLRLQGKQIGSHRVNFGNCFGSRSPVLISKFVLDQIASSKVNAAKYIRTDDLHPIQNAICRQWISIQNRASYRCSGSLSNTADAIHYGLGTYPYIHFTSPIRRYNDLVVHRLVHAAIFNRTSSPYTQEEIESICEHLNSVNKQANAFVKDCKILSQSFRLKNNPKIVTCCITDVTNTSAHIYTPELSMDLELPFNLLNIHNKSDIFKDSISELSRVDITWKKRLYDFAAKTKGQPYRDEELKLNPYKGFVAVTSDHWARILQCIVQGRDDDLRKCFKKHALLKNIHTGKHDDVSTECRNMSYLRTGTTFSMMFSQGQSIQLKVSAELEKGKVVPKPVLFNMTDNVKICLQHQRNPVLHLCHYATRPTLDQYKDTKSYVERWLPIYLMESATSTILNGNEFCINNVKIEFNDDRKGSFSLSMKECAVRNIVFSGGEDVTSGGQKLLSSYDWLCLKRVVLSKATTKCVEPHLGDVWIAHAVVNDVKKNSVEGTVTVVFTLHDNAPTLPPAASENDGFGVEVLSKSIFHRQTESLMATLPLLPDILASKIALNHPIPDLDESHKNLASTIEHDVHYKSKSTVDLRRNNTKQQEAIDKALVSRFSLIQGPPGTGKTHTGIILMYLFSKINEVSYTEGNPRKRVVYCGPSNKSVDLVADWMYRRMGADCPRFVRKYSHAIETKDFPVPGLFSDYVKCRTPTSLYPVALHHLIRQTGKPYAEKIKACYEKIKALYDEMKVFDEKFKSSNYEPVEKGKDIKQLKQNLEKKWGVFYSVVNEYINLLKEASAKEIQEHDVILCTTYVASNTTIIHRKSVQQIIIDEAGMCSEPECLAPIIASEAEQVVLIGDHKQLRPVVICKEAASLGLERSLFERYAEMKCAKNVQLTMLEEQYRMNQHLCRFPSEQFYNGLLVTNEALCASGSYFWPKDAKANYPFVFVHVEGSEKTLTISTDDGHEQSKSNEAEIDHTMKVYSYITKVHPKKTVRILSQYNAQCSEIKRRLRNNQMSDENVSTVVSSQGGEWDYVIFSTVRSLPSYKIERSPTIGWCRQNLGFITDENQINVALTRARKGLIIIGNKYLLACDKVWRNLIDHYQKRDCVKTVDEFPPSSGIKRSRNVCKTLKQKNEVKQIERRATVQLKRTTATECNEGGWQKVQKKNKRKR